MKLNCVACGATDTKLGALTFLIGKGADDLYCIDSIACIKRIHAQEETINRENN